MKDAGWEEDFFHTLPEDDEAHDTRGDVRIEAGGRAHGPVHLFLSTAETRGYLGLTTQPVLSCSGLSQPRASPPPFSRDRRRFGMRHTHISNEKDSSHFSSVGTLSFTNDWVIKDHHGPGARC